MKKFFEWVCEYFAIWAWGLFCITVLTIVWFFPNIIACNEDPEFQTGAAIMIHDDVWEEKTFIVQNLAQRSLFRIIDKNEQRYVVQVVGHFPKEVKDHYTYEVAREDAWMLQSAPDGLAEEIEKTSMTFLDQVNQ